MHDVPTAAPKKEAEAEAEAWLHRRGAHHLLCHQIYTMSHEYLFLLKGEKILHLTASTTWAILS